MKHRKHIAVGEKVPLELTERERDLFKKLEKELRQLCGRIADVLESYTDEPNRSAY